MMKKAVLLLLPVAAAAGPAALFSGAKWWSHQTDPAQASLDPALPHSLPAGPAGDSTRQVGPATAAHPRIPVMDLGEVLRFDISPDWIMKTWPRVSSGLAQLQLHGYRVSLLTGTRPDDLAGALTYYFDSHQRLQRITFHGTTGDARKLIYFLGARFGFVRLLTNDPGLVAYHVPGPRGQSAGYLHIRPAGVVRSTHPHTHFRVTFDIERPTWR